MSRPRHILIGLAAGGFLILAYRRLFDRRVAHTPASIPCSQPILTDEERAEFRQRWEQRYTGPRP